MTSSTTSMRVSVVGLGKLGTPTAAVFASRGHQVIGLDLDQSAVRAINEGRSPVFEPGLDDLIARSHDRLRATSDYADAVVASDVTFVIVPTPSDSTGRFSLRYVMGACEGIGRALRDKDGYHLVVITSTVLPGDTEAEILPAIETASGRRAGTDFGLCYSPEFIALGSVIRDLLEPDFTLVGQYDERSGELLESFHRTIVGSDVPVARTNIVNAEIAKLSVNAFVTMKISFANMISGMCEHLPGADVDVVTSTLGLDARIGHRYLRGALGYGGPCFPRDNLALTYVAKRLGAPVELATATDALNRGQVPHLVELVFSRLPTEGRVAVLGLSYKPETDVVEESQGLLLAAALLDARVGVTVYDPAAMDNARSALATAKFASSAREAAESADVVVLTTPWPEFADVDFSDLGSRSSKKVIIDCWRILDHASLGDSIEYVALGVGE